MKNIYSIIFAASAMFALSGCAQDLEDASAPITPSEPTTKLRTITASSEQQKDQTRTSLSKGEVLWTAGDKIRVMSASDPNTEGNYATYQLSEGAGTSQGKFVGDALTAPGVQWALYPEEVFQNSYDETVVGGWIDIQVSNTQKYKAGSFGEGANPMVAKSDENGENFKFVNLFGAIRLQLKLAEGSAGSVTVDKITFSSDQIETGFRVRMEYDDQGSFVNPIEGGPLKFFILTDINEELTPQVKDFTISLPAGEYSAGSKFTITTSDGYQVVKTTTKPFTVVRSRVTPLAPFDYVASAPKYFPDAAFRSHLERLHGLIVENDDIDPTNEENKEKFENVGELHNLPQEISSLKGIEFFKNLTKLRCYNTLLLDKLDISALSKLELLLCSDNRLTTLDISNNLALTELNCSNTQITTLDLSKNQALTTLNCNNTQITTLDLSKNLALTDLSCSDTQITTLDLSNNLALTKLYCLYTQITTLDLSNNQALTYLHCAGTRITTLDLSKNLALTYLNCFSSLITTLDLSVNTELKDLDCRYCKLTSITMPTSYSLKTLYCSWNQLTKLDLSKNLSLVDKFNFRIGSHSDAGGNPISITVTATANQVAQPLFTYDNDNERVNMEVAP